MSPARASQTTPQKPAIPDKPGIAAQIVHLTQKICKCFILPIKGASNDISFVYFWTTQDICLILAYLAVISNRLDTANTKLNHATFKL